MGSLLGKFYSGLLQEVRLWVAIAEVGRHIYVHMAYKLMFKSKAIGSSKQQTTSVYNCSRSNSSGRMRVLILQVINALHDKGFGHTRLAIFFVHSY